LQPSPNVIRVIESRRIRLAARVAHIGEMRMYTKFWSENPKGKDHSEELGVDGKIII
jgi:hypothetical protein